VLKALLSGIFALLSSVAFAQGFPERPIRIVVPLPPGGSPDTIARSLAQGLQNVWTQPVVVENRTGGNQNIGADAVAKSPPDGHTWLLAPDNVFAVNPHLGKQAFDPLLMGVTALWTAAHYRIPCLLLVANNRSFYNDEMHQERVARERGGAVCVVDVRVIPGYDSNLGGNARGAAAAARR